MTWRTAHGIAPSDATTTPETYLGPYRAERIDDSMEPALARLPGHVKNRGQLMRDANMVVDEGTITSHIKRIRKKIAAVDPKFDAVESVYGMGYRWRAPLA